MRTLCFGITSTRQVTLVLAKGSVTIVAGKSQVLTLKLTAVAGKLLKANRKLNATLTLTVDKRHQGKKFELRPSR